MPLAKLLDATCDLLATGLELAELAGFLVGAAVTLAPSAVEVPVNDLGAGTRTTFWHLGHLPCLPTAVSGTAIGCPQ
jgi:hypothetical protein